MCSTAIIDIVECLIGPNIRWQGSKLNMKSAGVGSPVGWHQDWALYPHTNDDLVAVGVPIDDMTTENGCLLVSPGSHSGPVLDHHDNGVFVGVVAPELNNRAACVPLEANAGSITLHHVRLLHGSAPNTSGNQRRLFLIEYNAADAWPLGGGKWERVESSLYCMGRLRNLRGWLGYPYAFHFRRRLARLDYQVQAEAWNRGINFERAS
jgi:phytanoyl-CoA hydroxylase